MRRWTLAATAGLALAGVTTWVAAAEHRGAAPAGDYEPRRVEDRVLTGPQAHAERLDTLKRAVFRLATPHTDSIAQAAFRPVRDELAEAMPECQFVNAEPSGTSPKFDCVFAGGLLVKVKYGRNPEIHAEAAASRLLNLLGYPADTVTILPRLRCYGCPRFPFIAMHLQSTFALPLLPAAGRAGGYTDFEWVSIERKFPAQAIETEDQKGWSWWELEASAAPRREVDALRLTAMFLAHWDNKSENQRLVCLDGLTAAAPPPPAPGGCAQPLALIQDLGATFGPSKVNLARWRAMPIWQDRAACRISMRAFPFEGASFPDATISEEGRALFASRLAAIPAQDVEALFVDARFPEFQVGTHDEGDVHAWVAAFRHRADQILSARCPQ